MDAEETHVERRVRESLDALGADYEVLPCDPELADTARFCEHYGISLEDSANAILVASKKDPKQYALCLVLATTRLDVNHVVRELMGVKRVSFARPEETVALTGMLVGGVTPFGLPDGLPIYVDGAVMKRERIVLGGGSRSCKIRCEPAVLERVAPVRIVDGLALPASAS